MNHSTEVFSRSPALLTPDQYPVLRTFPTGMVFSGVVVPRKEPPPPEYVYVPIGNLSQDDRTRVAVFICEWNIAWEWGRHRPAQFLQRLPERLRWLERRDDLNLRLVPLEGTAEQPDRAVAYCCPAGWLMAMRPGSAMAISRVEVRVPIA